MVEIRANLTLRWGQERIDAEGLLGWLLQRWSEPHRRYHDLRHLDECLDALDLLGAGQAERLAAWFHDVVYEGVTGHDERRSAALGRSWLRRAQVPAEVVAEVERLVLMTIEHDPAVGDTPAELLSDADLAILGAEPGRYRQSVADIRVEYARFDDEQWRTGRSQVLQGFLTRPHIFRSPLGQRRWEDRARSNIGLELASLRVR